MAKFRGPSENAKDENYVSSKPKRNFYTCPSMYMYSKQWAKKDNGEKAKHQIFAALERESDLEGSLAEDGLHYPVLDIDFHCEVRPSETQGHFHLRLDKGVEWDDYKELLLQLAKCGIIEPGYAQASIARGQTCVATRPWKKKALKNRFKNFTNVVKVGYF